MVQEEELLAFAHEDEEPELKIRYIPPFKMGSCGEYMYVLVGKTSKNRVFNSDKFPLDKQSPAEAYLRLMVSEWNKRQLAKKLEAEAANKKQSVKK